MLVVIYKQIPPPAHLASFVRFFWYYEINGITGSTPYVYRSMADSCTELIFHYKGRFRCPVNESIEPLSVIQGPGRSYTRYETSEDFGILGVYLYPFAANYLLGLPAMEIASQSVAINSISISGMVELEDRIMMATDNDSRINILSQFLSRKLNYANFSSPEPVSFAIKEMIHADNIGDIKDVSAKYCLSIRQFERRFKALSGMSPKLYYRLARFNKAMNCYGAVGKSLTDIAHECGYYDQSHFIHDFKEFSGYHPKTFFSGMAEGTEYRDI